MSGGLKEPDVLQKVDVTAFDDVLANGNNLTITCMTRLEAIAS